MQFQTYTTPNGSTILCDITNDFAYLLTDLAPQISASNGIKILDERPSQLGGVLDNYTLLEENGGGITQSILNNIIVSTDLTSAALATYLLNEWNNVA